MWPGSGCPRDQDFRGWFEDVTSRVGGMQNVGGNDEVGHENGMFIVIVG